MRAVRTWPDLPSGRAGRPLRLKAHAPASPTVNTAVRLTTTVSRSPAAISRDNTRLPSTTTVAQQGAVGWSSSRTSPDAAAADTSPVSVPEEVPTVSGVSDAGAGTAGASRTTAGLAGSTGRIW